MPARRWKLINDNRNLRQRAFYYTRLCADPKDKDTVYVLNVQFFKSTDGGKTTTTHPRAARRQPRPVDRGHRQPADGPGQRRRRQRHRSTAARRGPTRTFRPGSSTTCSRPSTCRITSAARSRTTRTACVGSQANPGAGEGSLPPIFYAVGGVIGPATARTCEEHGLRVDVIAAKPSVVDLADALASFAAQRRDAFLEAGEPVLKPSQRRPGTRRRV